MLPRWTCRFVRGGAGGSLDALPEEEYTTSGRLLLDEDRGRARREEEEEGELMPWQLPPDKANKVPLFPFGTQVCSGMCTPDTYMRHWLSECSVLSGELALS
jgi:hypothetical protein